jgi:hypothetical protein
VGANLNERGRVTGLPPGYEAGVARLQSADITVSIDGEVLERQPGGTVFRLLAEKIGQNSRLRIQRGTRHGPGKRRWVLRIRQRSQRRWQVADAAQLKIRESWLKR